MILFLMVLVFQTSLDKDWSHWSITVSYTHLDVYKRQAQDRENVREIEYLRGDIKYLKRAILDSRSINEENRRKIADRSLIDKDNL